MCGRLHSSGDGDGDSAGRGALAGWLDALRAGAPIDVPVVAVVAHPDDETVGFGLRLAAFRDLTLVHVTDGAPEDMGDARRAGFATRAAYARARAAELDRCLAALGAAPRRLSLGLRDQAAVFHLVELVQALTEPLAGAALALTHAYEGGHPDHDACAFAVQLACERLAARGRPVPVRLEFAEYHKAPTGEAAYGFWPEPDRPSTAPEPQPEAVARKQAALACHVSQAAITAWFDPAREAYRPAPAYDFSRPPPPGASIYDDWGWALTSERWRAAARAALATLRGEA